MKKVLFVSHAPWNTSGYGRVIDNIIKANEKNPRIEIHVVCGHFGNPINYHGATIYGLGASEQGYDVLPYYLANIVKPDYLVTLFDVAFQKAYFPIINNLRQKGIWMGKWFGYVPIDSLNLAFWTKPIFEKMDKVIAMSEFASKMLKDNGIDNVCIPHGVDPNVYKPLKNREELKVNTGLKNKFVVISVGLNQKRKMWDKILKGFTIFNKRHKDTLLLCHTDRTASSKGVFEGFDLTVLADKYGIIESFAYTMDEKTMNAIPRFWRQFITEEKMNEIYNCADVAIFGGAEGFGLPILESQSAGLPVIVGDQCTAKELVKGGFRSKIEYSIEGSVGVEFGSPSAQDFADKLELLYKDTRIYKRESKRARDGAITYDWDKIIQKWFEIFI